MRGEYNLDFRRATNDITLLVRPNRRAKGRDHEGGHLVTNDGPDTKGKRSLITLLRRFLLGKSKGYITLGAFLVASLVIMHNPSSESRSHNIIRPDKCKERFGISYHALLDGVRNSTNFCPLNSSFCECTSPFFPERSKILLEDWNRTFDRNKHYANQPPHHYDVIFFGDSITQHWNGDDLGPLWNTWGDINHVFKEHFRKSHGAKVEGLALGIGGDKTRQLLYRMQNGEFPPSLDAEVFWLLIGTNDLGADNCAPESVVAGNIRIIEEIRARRPKAKIVLNSILPRTDLWTHGAWPDSPMDKINHWLECYTADTESDGIEFFNATSIFLNVDGSSEKEEYFQDFVHPNGAGHRAWAQAIVDRVLEITS